MPHTESPEYKALLQAFKQGDASRYVHLLVRHQRDGHPVCEWITTDKLARDWIAFTSWAFDAKKEEAQGYVFMAVHTANNNLIKIGKTKFAPHTRLKQLQAELGAPVKLVKSWAVFDRVYFHRLLDETLASVPKNGAFYCTDPDRLISRINEKLLKEYRTLRPLNQFGLIVPASDSPPKPDFFTGV